MSTAPARRSALDRRLPEGALASSASGGRGAGAPIETFAVLYAEVIAYHRARTASTAELEARLADAGAGVGARLCELFALRSGRREPDAVSAVKSLSGAVWTQLFGRPADLLDVNKEGGAVEYRIWDALPATNTFISVPKEYSRFNPAAFIAGIIRGMLDSAGFPCSVAAMSAATDGAVDSTVFVIKFV